MTILIYGRSDDLIEVEESITSELYADYGEPTTIRFSNGDTFRVKYNTSGEWSVDIMDINDDMTKAEVLEVGAIETLCDYSQVAVYNPWDSVEGVEKVE